MRTPPAHETTLFQGPLPQENRRWTRPPRWGVVTTAVLLTIAAIVAMSLLSLTRAVLHRDAGRDSLKVAAVQALPRDARTVTTGFFGQTHAYAIADVAGAAPEVLATFGATWGKGRWHQIPGTSTPDGRSFLSAGQDRILEITVDPCHREREHCPPGGSTVTSEVFVGGPKS